MRCGLASRSAHDRALRLELPKQNQTLRSVTERRSAASSGRHMLRAAVVLDRDRMGLGPPPKLCAASSFPLQEGKRDAAILSVMSSTASIASSKAPLATDLTDRDLRAYPHSDLLRWTALGSVHRPQERKCTKGRTALRRFHSVNWMRSSSNGIPHQKASCAGSPRPP